MEEALFCERLAKGCASLGLEVDDAAAGRLYGYFRELKKWSRKVNLIARGTGDEQIVENHFLDSLTLLPFLQGEDIRLLDVGSGAGFPGLVVAAARPEIGITLVEPRLKRVSFLRHVVRTLGLGEVTVLSCRVEDEAVLPSDMRLSHITSRAVSEVGEFLAMAARFARPGCEVICMKGPKWREELEAGASQIEALPFCLKRVVEHRLPFSGAERALLVFGHRGSCDRG